MSIKRKRWTDDEEQVVISKVRANPNNLNKAFREAALELDRNSESISLRWYKKTKSQPALKDRCGKLFMTYGPKTLNVNRKNVSAITSDNTITLTMDKVQQILEILLS